MTDRIEINPSVMLGKPVVRNTRIPVELVLRKLAEGATVPTFSMRIRGYTDAICAPASRTAEANMKMIILPAPREVLKNCA